jgi:membrane-bound lytic murein transglycosylase D
MKPTLRLLPVVLASLMAACATTPPPAKNPITAPAVAPAPVRIPASATSVATVAQPPIAAESADVWDKMRNSFAMSDCDADPQIMVWARRYTQNPQRFEAQMKSAVPQLIYVQQVAEKYNVAGEFVLLPWVESQYQAKPGHRNLPAGMWQIEPSTAHSMGLHVDHGYDGRLDTSAATDRVMHMLRDYYDELHDWRLVDYAFNRGEFAVQHMVQQHGLPPPEPAIPKVACSARDKRTSDQIAGARMRYPRTLPIQRNLPTLAAEDHLEAVDITPGMTLSTTASHAGMLADDLRRLNPAMSNDALNSGSGSQILMPHRNAEQWRNAMQSANAQDMTASNAPLNDTPSSNAADVAQDSAPAAVKSHAVRTHTVKPGESLWQIAHKYSVSVNTLGASEQPPWKAAETRAGIEARCAVNPCLDVWKPYRAMPAKLPTLRQMAH